MYLLIKLTLALAVNYSRRYRSVNRYLGLSTHITLEQRISCVLIEDDSVLKNEKNSTSTNLKIQASMKVHAQSKRND